MDAQWDASQMVEVTLMPDIFSKQETSPELESPQERLYQSCHILHKQGDTTSYTLRNCSC